MSTGKITKIVVDCHFKEVLEYLDEVEIEL
jgi:hypothetical protein